MRHPRTRDRDTYYLSNAHQHGALIRVTCGGCSPPRLYMPQDLMTLLGDLAVMELDEKMHCERCGKTTRARTFHPTIKERDGLVVRRLAQVKTVRKVEWREERL